MKTSRDALQILAAQRLAHNKRLILQWATGVGKSGVVMQFLRERPEATCLIVVPEQNNIENWTVEFSKFGVPMELVRVICYASLHKYENTEWDLLVFDEMPHVDTLKRLAICRSVQGKYILALGAVIDDDERASLSSVYGPFDVNEISLTDAIEMNILPIPQIRVVHLSLDDCKGSYWYKGQKMTAREMYDRIQRKVQDAVSRHENERSAFNRRKMLSAGSERKRLLGLLKQDAIKLICERLEEKNRRFLCFCSSISQAEQLGGERAFTSKTPASAKTLQRFNNHELNSLYVVGKLIEGQNLTDIECGVIGQLGGTQRITVQEVGRIMRSENPIIYIPVIDGSKDGSFLFTLTANIPKSYIKHYKL